MYLETIDHRFYIGRILHSLTPEVALNFAVAFFIDLWKEAVKMELVEEFYETEILIFANISYVVTSDWTKETIGVAIRSKPGELCLFFTWVGLHEICKKLEAKIQAKDLGF
jgi:hypothetical protein